MRWFVPRIHVSGSFPRLKKPVSACCCTTLFFVSVWCVIWLVELTTVPLDVPIHTNLSISRVTTQSATRSGPMLQDSEPMLTALANPSSTVFNKMRVWDGTTRANPSSTAVRTSSATDAVSAGCKLPHLDSFDDVAMEFFERLQPIRCEGTLFTRYQGNTLKVIATNDRGAPLSHISYQPILHKEQDGFILGQETFLDFKSQLGVRPQRDFIKVTAEFTNGMIQTDYYARAIAKTDVIGRRPRSHTGIPLDIVIIGFDGASTGSFQRLLPKTFEYLRDGLKAFIFEGFSLLGEGTTPQLTGLLTGKTLEANCKTHEGRRGYADSGPIDEWPFIFKSLMDHGYATMFSEDAPVMGAFNMRLEGFKKPPCDHYARPFWLAVPYDGNTYLHDDCINSQPQHVLQLEYLRSLFEAYPDTPKFGFTYFCSLCHRYESVNTVSGAAEDVLTFVKAFNDSGYLDNAMLIMMGDHGPRIGAFRSTLQGKLEERLPFLSVVLPQWFQRRYSEMVKNFRSNTRRLITPLDLHATLMHLLTYPVDPSHSSLTTGSSLFSRIPPSRTCAQAQIPEYFCPCVVWEPISTDHVISETAAQTSVDFINDLLAQSKHVKKLCSELKLHKILSVVLEMPNEKVQLFRGIKNGDGLGIGHAQFNAKNRLEEFRYQVQFQTLPGFGMFEALVKVTRSWFVVQSEVSRINRYGHQAGCIRHTNPYLMKFCFCKKASNQTFN